jgi:SAM-dependent methyltransferase
MKYSRKEQIIQHYNGYADSLDIWKNKSHFFHSEDIKYLSFLVPKKNKILELGCSNGDLLSELKASHATGIDVSEKMVANAKNNYPNFKFINGDIEDDSLIDSIDEKFDFIIMSDTIGLLEDCQSTIESLHSLCKRETRLIISYYSRFWQPILKLAELFKLRMPVPEENFLTTDDIENILKLANFDVVKKEWRQLLPIRLFGIGSFINKYIAPLPLIRKLCLRNYLVARSLEHIDTSINSCSVIVPCRNERGNIENIVKRIPDFCEDIEIIFIEGHSQDDTYEEILRMKSVYKNKNIIALQQVGIGKADAVYKAFNHATKDVLMILDADMTMPPEQLDKFWNAIKSGKGEYINGSRLVYPLEKDAMRFLNFIANRCFSFLFSWLLNQRYTDTLCGTKVLRKTDYILLDKNKSYFGDFDPFGDFDLIFGSSKLNLKMAEIPIRYQAREYGSTQISRFKHGLILLQMVIYGFKKLKAF